MVSRPWAFETMVIAVLLEPEKRIEQVLKRLEALQRRGITPWLKPWCCLWWTSMAPRTPPKPTTLDDLAAMINHGFTETQTYIKKRLGDMDQRLDDMKGVLKDVVQELTATHEDGRSIRTTVNLLVRNDVAQDAAIKTLSARVARLEKKVGLTNWPPIISKWDSTINNARPTQVGFSHTYAQAICPNQTEQV
jgi:hypothetical protein